MTLMLSATYRQKLKLALWNEERYRQYPYKDTTGHLTVGCGRNLDAIGISQDEALYLLANDISRTESEIWRCAPLYERLSDSRKCVILDMGFNMGVADVMQFRHMWAAIEKDDYEAAAVAMLESKWHADVGHRADKLAEIMRTGVMP